ncbi:ABC transporter ATP-binding protein [Enterovirga sp.]|uniref:ABC transporter ATP-binding protein n=1 Tax=Enterovirga sp. TaxID=2026350 RepID=UPI002612FCA5|nr:ABC transporter ATP-binding protein [Enterovirga sp.]MDB5590858.1 iron transporter ATP-binding protein [Enterovirga sp.]
MQRHAPAPGSLVAAPVEPLPPAPPRLSGRAAATLSVEDVRCRFGTKTVLRGVSFEAPPAAVTCLLGPSGCGKTTLLRILAGIERPSAGRVMLDGEEVAGPAVFVPAESRRVGLMFQDYALFPHLTVLDNVLFGLRHLPRGEARPVAEAALDRVGLAGLAGRRPSELSGGEQQRAALARAIAPAPRALLLDEPFSNLDRGLRDDLRDSTAALLRDSRITALVVTHDPDEAMQMADHIVLLSAGEVLAAGRAEDLYRRPASLAVARALADVNEVPGRMAGGWIETGLGRFPGLGHHPDGAAAILAIRPEGIRIGPAGSGRPGRIASRVFRGAASSVRVEIEGLDAPIRAVVNRSAAAPGDLVSVEVEPDSAFVFLA